MALSISAARDRLFLSFFLSRLRCAAWCSDAISCCLLLSATVPDSKPLSLAPFLSVFFLSSASTPIRPVSCSSCFCLCSSIYVLRTILSLCFFCGLFCFVCVWVFVLFGLCVIFF